MPGVFRFPNAASDIGKFIKSYQSIYNHFIDYTKQGFYFDHHQASEFLALNGLASSLGAIGNEAVKRSRRADNSRDPLYNQHKMYSELYRMLGWYEPGSKRTNFLLPEYGGYIAENNDETVRKLFSLNFLHITSPNPLTTIRGGNVLRPVPLILKMLGSLGGYLSRDEMILSVLACPNDHDNNSNYLKDQVNRINNLRSNNITGLNNEISNLMGTNNIRSKDVLPNYTRFPIAALKWTGWAESINNRSFYNGKNLRYLRLTSKGKQVLDCINQSIDIRYNDLLGYTDEEKAAFVAWSNLHQLGCLGFDTNCYSNSIHNLLTIADRIFSHFNITLSTKLLFFGYQEAPRDILKLGDQFLKE